MNQMDDDFVDFSYETAFGELEDQYNSGAYNGTGLEPSTSGVPLVDDYYSLDDSSLNNIPMDPVYTDSPYQQMSGVQYEELQMPMEMQNQPAYNSFEQPVVVNRLDSPFSQQIYYQTEQPSTSGMHSVQQHQQGQSHQPGMQTMLNANQPSRSSNQQIQLQQHQQPHMVMASNGPVLQPPQQQPRPQQQRQSLPKSTSKNRPIQPKTASNQSRRRNNNYTSTNSTVGEVLKSANTIAANTIAGTAGTVHLKPESVMEVTTLLAQIAGLEQNPQENAVRLEELKKQLTMIFLVQSQAQNVGAPIINELKQVCVNGGPAPAPAQPTPVRKTAPRRANPPANSNIGQQQPILQHQPIQHQPQQQAMPPYSQSNHQYTDVQYSQPDSPQYQPNYIHSQPSTSVSAGAQIYTADYSSQPLQMELQNHHHHRQQTNRVYVTQPMQAIQVTTSYQTPQGPMYLQHGTSSEPHYSQIQQPGPTISSTPRNRAKPRHVVLQQQQQQQPIRAVLSPGPSILSHPHQQPQQPMHQMQPMRQPNPIQGPIVPAQAPPRPPPPRPIRQTGSDATRRCEVMREQRRDKVKDFMKDFHSAMLNPDSERPFTGMKDTLMRLLPFHCLQEPEIHEDEFNQFDDNYLRHMINMEMDKQRIERRIRGALFKETMNQRDREECNLLLFLDGEYEKRKLAEEKQNVNDCNTGEFVRPTELIPSLPPTNLHVRPKDLDKIPINYDYHSFSEIPRSISPYKSPSPVKSRKNSIRSPSPLKSRSSSKCWSPLKSLPIMAAPDTVESRARTISASSTSVVPTPNRPKSQKERKRIPVKEPRIAVSKANAVAQPKIEDVVLDDFVLPIVADVKPLVMKIKPERPEITLKKVDRSRKASSSRATESNSEVKHEEVTLEPPKMRLPAKKELLSRARNATPLALRSPPAHNSRSSWEAVKKPAVPIENGVDTDGSCSPELGMDDVFDTVPSVLANKAGSSVENTSPELVTPAAIIQEKPVIMKQKPVPPPIRPKNREPLKQKEPITTSSKRSVEDVTSRTVADPPRIRFKPQVPRPSSQASYHKPEDTIASTIKKEPKLDTVVPSKEAKIMETPKVIRLKLLFGGVATSRNMDVPPIECEHERTSKEKKKKKKKKHKRERDKMADSDSEVESKKMHLDTDGAMVVTPIAGTGLMKIVISRSSRTSTPNGDLRSATRRSEPTKRNLKSFPRKPATPTPVGEIRPPVRIRIKPLKSPSLPQNSPVTEAITAPSLPQRSPVIEAISASSLRRDNPVIEAGSAPTTVQHPITVTSPHVPLVNFSDDDSNSDDEHIKATDKAMRGYGFFSKQPVPSGPLLPPWASSK